MQKNIYTKNNIIYEILDNYIYLSNKVLHQAEGVVFLEITDVRVRKIGNKGKMKAVVSITFDNQFVIHDIKVIQGDNGLFIAMPSRKAPDGTFKDIAHPINSDTRELLQKLILEKYENTADEEVESVNEEVNQE